MDLDYHDIVFSMKASNPQIMVQAYRLLVHKMMAEGMNYPLHLGVTEAGDGEDGRIKSAVGIGALLEDGLGDTVRVSLTEEPEAEIPVAQTLVARYCNRSDHAPIPGHSNIAYRSIFLHPPRNATGRKNRQTECPHRHSHATGQHHPRIPANLWLFVRRGTRQMAHRRHGR